MRGPKGPKSGRNDSAHMFYCEKNASSRRCLSARVDGSKMAARSSEKTSRKVLGTPHDSLRRAGEYQESRKRFRTVIWFSGYFKGPWEDPMRISHRHQDSFKADFLSIRANAGSAGLRGTARSAPFRIPAVLEVAASTFWGEAVAESGQEPRQPHRPTIQSRIDEGLSLT